MAIYKFVLNRYSRFYSHRKDHYIDRAISVKGASPQSQLRLNIFTLMTDLQRDFAFRKRDLFLLFYYSWLLLFNAP